MKQNQLVGGKETKSLEQIAEQFHSLLETVIHAYKGKLPNPDICEPDLPGEALAEEWIKKADSLLSAVKAQQQTSWIKTSERIPTGKDGNRHRKVLIWSKLSETTKEVFWHEVEGESIHDVWPYWMPIPPLPDAPSASGDNPAPTDQSLPSAEVNPSTANDPQAPLPCPFCGDKSQTTGAHSGLQYTKCANCGLGVADIQSWLLGHVQEHPRKVWNKRVPQIPARESQSTDSGLPQEKSVSAQQPQKEEWYSIHCAVCRKDEKYGGSIVLFTCETEADAVHAVEMHNASAPQSIPIPRELVSLVGQTTIRFPVRWWQDPDDDNGWWLVYGEKGKEMSIIPAFQAHSDWPNRIESKLIVAAVNFVADLARREKKDL